MKKKYLILIVILAIVIAGVLVYVYLHKKTPYQPSPYGGWQTYTSSTYGFSVQYPPNYNFYNGQDPHYTIDEFFVGSGRLLITIELPIDGYPGTNYYDSFLIFFVAQDENSATTCNKAQQLGSTDLVNLQDTQTIKGQVFYQGEADGAAAGTLVKTKIYHTVYNNVCYEASASIVEGNIDNYPQGKVHQFDEGDVWDKLTAVLDTLGFKEK